MYTNIEAGGGVAGQKYESRRTDCCTKNMAPMEAGGMAVQKYGNRRRDVCTEIWKKGWLYRNMEAAGEIAVRKYGSRRRDGCTEI
jgi:hypothetical protein